MNTTNAKKSKSLKKTKKSKYISEQCFLPTWFKKMLNKKDRVWRLCEQGVCLITKDHPSVLGDDNNFLLAKHLVLPKQNMCLHTD